MPTFAALADTLVDDFDLLDLLNLLTERCVEVFGVSASGLMLAGPQEELRVVASSSDTMRLLELFELQAQEGPCIDCFRTKRPVEAQLLARADQWPRFGPKALAAGFASVLALPMRLRGQMIGALNLFSADETCLAPDDLVVAQAMTDVATIAVVQHRASREAQTLNEQLNEALRSRILIEQAKGVMAERSGTDVGMAFAAMRTYARGRGLRLTDVASQPVAGTLEILSRRPRSWSAAPIRDRQPG